VTDIYERSTGQPLISSIAYGGPLDAPEVEHLELPPSPVPEVEEQLEPEVEEQPVPEVQEQPVPEVQEQPMPEVQEQPAPLISETAEPDPVVPEVGEEAGAAAPSEAEPVSPEAVSYLKWARKPALPRRAKRNP
jgi:hypothetical protein